MHVLHDAKAALGECALWCEQEQALWWADIDAGRLHRWQHGAEPRHWQLPQKLGSFALCEEPGQLLLGLAEGVALFDTRTGVLGPIAPVEADQLATRINDGRCDPQGRFVFGMFNQLGPAALGHFWRVGPGLSAERLPLPPATVGNGLCFSPDGGTLYFTDSPTRTIWQASYPAHGVPGEPTVLVRFQAEDGEPDGATVDAEGRLWVALWGAACVAVLTPAGHEVCRVPVPAAHPTCPVFGGPMLQDLFVTSARCVLDAQGLKRWPHAGSVFRLLAAGRGRVEHRFRVAASADS